MLSLTWIVFSTDTKVPTIWLHNRMTTRILLTSLSFNEAQFKERMLLLWKDKPNDKEAAIPLILVNRTANKDNYLQIDFCPIIHNVS